MLHRVLCSYLSGLSARAQLVHLFLAFCVVTALGYHYPDTTQISKGMRLHSYYRTAAFIIVLVLVGFLAAVTTQRASTFL